MGLVIFWFFGLLNPFSRLPKTTCIMQDNVRQVMGKKEALDIRNDEVIDKKGVKSTALTKHTKKKA